MYITNGLNATLVKYNRGLEENTGVWDDEYTKEESIVLCPYNQDVSVGFGIYSVPEAKGYFIVKNDVDVKEGLLGTVSILSPHSFSLQSY